MSETTLDLSIVIPSMDEAENLDALLPALREVMDTLGLHAEILVIDKASTDGTPGVAARHGATYVCESQPGYGAALRRGIAEARGQYILTMDADLSHPAEFITALWAARETADVVIASRYVEGGAADQPAFRYWLSRVLNGFFRKGLSLEARDLTSGYRLYHREVFREVRPSSTNFVVLVEILLLAFREGRQIAEVPFHYRPRGTGRSHAQILRFGVEYLRFFLRMWRLRNGIDFPDYDWRAYDSRIPLQRWWQRKRHEYVMAFTTPGVSTADIGCGSSRILAELPHAVAVDMRMNKLRFMKPHCRKLFLGDGCKLPLPSNTFECVINSQVIEHVPEENGRMLDELTRILKPGGILVIGTPDYGGWQWPLIERLYHLAAPNAYADEHVTHYTFDSLTTALRARGFEILDHAYILKGELIIQARLRD
jgi:dolichol-phosphate mannosyltransferase